MDTTPGTAITITADAGCVLVVEPVNSATVRVRNVVVGPPPPPDPIAPVSVGDGGGPSPLTTWATVRDSESARHPAAV